MIKAKIRVFEAKVTPYNQERLKKGIGEPIFYTYQTVHNLYGFASRLQHIYFDVYGPTPENFIRDMTVRLSRGEVIFAPDGYAYCVDLNSLMTKSHAQLDAIMRGA